MNSRVSELLSNLASSTKGLVYDPACGIAEVIVRTRTKRAGGGRLVGHDINDLLGEATMIALLEATTIEVGFAVHTHPTLAEAIKEAALAVDGEAIHIARRRAGTQPPEGAANR